MFVILSGIATPVSGANIPLDAEAFRVWVYVAAVCDHVRCEGCAHIVSNTCERAKEYM